VVRSGATQRQQQQSPGDDLGLHHSPPPPSCSVPCRRLLCSTPSLSTTLGRVVGDGGPAPPHHVGLWCFPWSTQGCRSILFPVSWCGGFHSKGVPERVSCTPMQTIILTHDERVHLMHMYKFTSNTPPSFIQDLFVLDSKTNENKSNPSRH
jgi:hypothetical protein